MTATKKTYKTTFILDTRGREEPIEQLIEDLKKEIASLDIEVSSMENLGRRDFARQPDVNVTAGNYVQFMLEGTPEAPARLREHFRLNKLIYRILLQNA
ncbi:MAG: 30S ribosomal protein S6 [Opitutaceae bacterium]